MVKNRAKVAIAKLRRLGLREAVTTDLSSETGYRLAPEQRFLTCGEVTARETCRVNRRRESGSS